jgi:hypothetical protein
MSAAWTPDDVRRIDSADELQIAATTLRLTPEQDRITSA